MGTNVETVTTVVTTETTYPDPVETAVEVIEVPVEIPAPIPEIIIVDDEMSEEMSQEILDRLAAIEGRLPVADVTPEVVPDEETGTPAPDDVPDDDIPPVVDDPETETEEEPETDPEHPGYDRPEIEKPAGKVKKEKKERAPRQNLGWRKYLMAGSGGTNH